MTGLTAAQRRPLTAGEIDWARRAFGDRLPLERVTLVNGAGGNPLALAAIRNGNSAITLGRTIHFSPAYYLPDFSTAKPAARGLMIHELTHVWQYARLGMPRFFARYARDYAACGFTAWRMYEYAPGTAAFTAARLEAQASMVGDYGEALAAGDEGRRLQVAQNLKGSGFFGL